MLSIRILLPAPRVYHNLSSTDIRRLNKTSSDDFPTIFSPYVFFELGPRHTQETLCTCFNEIEINNSDQWTIYCVCTSERNAVVNFLILIANTRCRFFSREAAAGVSGFSLSYTSETRHILNGLCRVLPWRTDNESSLSRPWSVSTLDCPRSYEF